MKLKLFVAATISITGSTATFAAEDKPNQPPMPTIEEVQKVVKTISGDKKKLQAYCELGRLQQQMEEAEEKNDTKLITEQHTRCVKKGAPFVEPPSHFVMPP